MIDYPRDPEDSWSLSTLRAPRWIIDRVNRAAMKANTESWVVLSDWLVRANRVTPPSPPLPLAVTRRYHGVYTDAGTLVETEATAESAPIKQLGLRMSDEEKLATYDREAADDERRGAKRTSRKTHGAMRSRKQSA